MYKKKLYNMEAKRYPKIASKSSQNPHLQLKWGWHKDAECSLDHRGIKEEIILKNNDKIKNIITSKFKDKLWDNMKLERKMKLRYYKEVFNPNLKN